MLGLFFFFFFCNFRTQIWFVTSGRVRVYIIQIKRAIILHIPYIILAAVAKNVYSIATWRFSILSIRR